MAVSLNTSGRGVTITNGSGYVTVAWGELDVLVEALRKAKMEQAVGDHLAQVNSYSRAIADAGQGA